MHCCFFVVVTVFVSLGRISWNLCKDKCAMRQRIDLEMSKKSCRKNERGKQVDLYAWKSDPANLLKYKFAVLA